MASLLSFGLLFCCKINFTFHETCFVLLSRVSEPFKTPYEKVRSYLSAVLLNYYFVLPSVPSSYSYLSEGSILRLLFDFLDKAAKTGLLAERVITTNFYLLPLVVKLHFYLVSSTL